ncbi:lipopolysaccharide assembly protein LapB [Hahella sp. NBU794]|uniref:lipopolysaccharide assembly protein LapB n=1 Tax=Hahella sp. NBU794 TaxID=3422590 RepID=UPI003D7008AD
MEYLGQLLLIAVAIGIGWLICFIQGRVGQTARAIRRGGEYPKSLQYLFEAYDAPTLDSFVQELEINQHTVQLHLSIANFFRRKGEIEKATAIHQNLLSHPDARIKHGEQLTYELAQDYMFVGLYDRAEALFIELAASRQWRKLSTECLLEIYEHEKEWGVARERALTLDFKRDRDVQVRLAQYCCEMAERSMRRKEYSDATRHLREALMYDKFCARASIQVAQVCVATEQYPEALAELKRIEQQNPMFLSEVVGLVKEICEKLNERERLLKILQRMWELQPSAKVMIALSGALNENENMEEAIEFLLGQLNAHPTLGGVKALLVLLVPYADPEPKRWIMIVKGVLETLLEKNHSYLCESCGFSGRHLHWQCPSCKKWGVVKPLPWV